MSSTSCMICCENYNKSNHALVCCPNKECAHEACKECIRTYLLGKTIAPHCMSCKQAWSNYFMVMNLNKTFVDTTYMDHRGVMLMDREKSKMPDTMNAVHNYVKGEELDKEAQELDKEIVAISKKLRDLSRAKNEKIALSNELKSGKKSVSEERKKFIMPCPCDDCRGFLSSAYKCEACKNHACSKCLEVLGPNPNHVEHVCDQDAVKTTELIKNTTKACPKCGERISKIEGCDQMWCVSCHGAFSWKTGLEDNGVVHNPHYYQYQRQVNNGNAPRNPGDVVCGGLPNWFAMRRTIRTKWTQSDTPGSLNPDDLIDFLSVIQLTETIHRSIAHMTHHELPTIRYRVRDAQDYRQLRIDYILNRISEKKMGAIMSLNDKKMMRDTELLHLYELYSVIGIEIFASIQNKVNYAPDDNSLSITAMDMCCFMKEKVNEFIRFANYCNNELSMISVSYNCSVPITRISNYRCSHLREKVTLKKIKELQEENNTHLIACY